MELNESIKLIMEINDTHKFSPCHLCLSEEFNWCKNNKNCGYDPTIECYEKYLWIKVREKVINKMKEIK